MPPSPFRRTRIKFCGFTDVADLHAAVELGVDAIGLVCVPGSRRELSPTAAAALRRQVPPLVSVVLLLSNAPDDVAARAIAAIRPDLLQFHGQESAEACSRHGLAYIKAVSVRTADDIFRASAAHAGTAALLLDSHDAGGLGGTGHSFDWAQIPANVGHRLILAGGLNPDNVGRAVRMSTPYAVDVSSGIESAPGRKDPARMQAFVEAVCRADTAAKP